MKDQILENTKVPQIVMHNHRTQLRRSLLSDSHWDKKQNMKFLFWKGGEEEMRRKRFLTMTLGAFVVVLALIFVFMPKNTQKVYAEQVAQESFKAITSLNPEELKNLKEKVRDDSKDILEQAKNAKDLKYFTYDEYVKANPKFAHIPTPPKLDGEKIPDLKNARFLEFTDTNGAKVMVAIDPDSDLPFFITKKIFKGEIIKRIFKGEGKGTGEPGNAVFRTQNGGEAGGFGMGIANKEGSRDIMFQVKTDGKAPVLTVNGKKYELPEGFTPDPGTPPDIKVEGEDVYVNGQKAKPIE